MRPGTAREVPVATRDRILDAATRRFARHSYEDAGLRDIAADVDVDVAYVHRCFGSKQQLFAEAVRSTADTDRFLSGAAEELPTTLAREILTIRAPDEISPLDIVIRSLSSPEASRVLRAFVLDDLIDPLAGKLQRPPDSALALVAAFMAGVGILRNVLHIDPLLVSEDGELEHHIARAIACMLKGADHPQDTERQL